MFQPDDVDSDVSGTRANHIGRGDPLSIPMTMTFLSELFDSNLTDAEFRALLYIRVRAGRNLEEWASDDVMADHLGKSKRTVECLLSSLREKGYLSVKARGFGQTRTKSLCDPTDVYGIERMRLAYMDMKSDAPAGSVARLRSIDRQGNNAPHNDGADAIPAENCGDDHTRRKLRHIPAENCGTAEPDFWRKQ